MRLSVWLNLLLIALVASCASSSLGPGPRPLPPPTTVSGRPPAMWDQRPDAAAWTASAVSAIDSERAVLLARTPTDIDAFCPGFRNADESARRAFYVALLSQLAVAESTLDPGAQGGAARGLLQITPETARAYGCTATSSAALLEPTANLACGVKILARLIEKDGVISGYENGWKGAARTWTPFRQGAKLVDLQGVGRRYAYCRGGPARQS
jgi:hypothetical protein